MYTGLNENQLILPNIVDALHDYCSIQLDIDETKCKSAELLAQNIDIKRENEMTDLDKQLKALVIPALCWYTYSRLLLLFHTTFTDSGLVSAQDDGAEARNAAKSLSKECKGVAESMMLDVIEFLEEEADEDPTIDKTKFDQEKLTPRIRTFGGVEWRGSN